MTSLPNALPHSLARTVIIRAEPATVFRYFTDSDRWAQWWGAGSTIDARPGGKVRVIMPGNVEAGGEIVEVLAPKRIIFTYGYATGTPIPLGGSRITIELTADPAGTRLELRHDLASAAARDEHVQGWRYQLSVFSNVVSDHVNAGAATIVDDWFDAWAEPDVAKREATINRIAAPGILFNDRYSNLETVPDVLAHITASQRFMPGIRLKRNGNVRHCQGMVLADFVATRADGTEVMRGANVFVLGPSGTLEAVTGFGAS